MAYLTRKRIKGITYYYAEESERRNGKSRRKWQKYLGPLPKIIEALEGRPQKPKYAEMSMSMNKLHEKLSGIREVLNVFSKGKKKQSTQSVVTKMDEVQQRLFDLFRMEQYLSS